MKRALLCVALAGLASGVQGASAQLGQQVLPAWTALVAPELATEKGLAEPSAELRACFEAHRDALIKKPNVIAPLVADYTGSDALRRECALAAEVDMLGKHWRLSSPVNSYSPLISAMSKQRGSLATKSDMEKCLGRQFIYDSAVTFNGIVAGMAPTHTYSWVKPEPGAPCVAAAQ